MPIGGERNAHPKWRLPRFPDARGHAPADEVASVAHRTGFRITFGPAEGLRPLAIAFPQRLAAVAAAGVLVTIRITSQAKLQRIEIERDRELVHRAFESVDT